MPGGDKTGPDGTFIDCIPSDGIPRPRRFFYPYGRRLGLGRRRGWRGGR